MLRRYIIYFCHNVIGNETNNIWIQCNIRNYNFDGCVALIMIIHYVVLLFMKSSTPIHFRYPGLGV